MDDYSAVASATPISVIDRDNAVATAHSGRQSSLCPACFPALITGERCFSQGYATIASLGTPNVSGDAYGALPLSLDTSVNNSDVKDTYK